MLEKSTPVITNPPMRPHVVLHELSGHVINLDGARARAILGWKPDKPQINGEAVAQVVQGWRSEKTAWPSAQK